jgi:NAD(P)H-quinone oxidoreductase subunit 5
MLFPPLALLAVAVWIASTKSFAGGKAAGVAEYAGLSGLAALLIGASAAALGGTAGGLSLTRVDSVSVIMLLLVTFIGWIVLRYARSYLDREPGQARFTAWMCATLAAVLILVQANHLMLFALAWIATSLCLHRLLLFYPQRPAAQRAAAKKFVIARAGDVALILAALTLYRTFDTAFISEILAQSRAGAAGTGVQAAAALLALAALLKSAQFPTHGWLTEVMETPTPVSALLHAGVINAGGFLLIRFADVMLLSPLVLAALVLVGGFTALFGGLVMLTQPAIKTALAWSTVAQMGFMVLQCGLALFPLALLHIVAHSLYKAHAFLSSGGAVAQVASIRRPGPVAVPGLAAVSRAFALGLAIYLGVYLLLHEVIGLGAKSPQAVALGAILIFGVAYLIAQGLADRAPRALTKRTALFATAATLSYLVLQRLSEWLTADVLPPAPVPGPLEWALIALALISFGLVALAQACLPHWAHHPATQGLRVHLVNGFYINALTDRLLGGWRTPHPSGKGEKA